MKTVVKNLIVIVFILIHFSCIENKESKSEFVDPKKMVAIDSSIKGETKTTIEKSIKTKEMERNKNLIGVWRNTEVLSSGSGDSYISFATDYFVEFQENGLFLSLVGSSAGSGYSYQSEERNNANPLEWETRDNVIILKDPNSSEEASMNFFIENGRLMLSSESSRKIYEKTQ